MVVLALELYWLLKAVHSLAITRLLRHLKRAAVPPPQRAVPFVPSKATGASRACNSERWSVSRRIMRALVGGPLRGGVALLR
jgi:hypothetical protein